MRIKVEYAGIYKDRLATGEYTFGGGNGKASGTSVNCRGGEYSFGGYGASINGKFFYCIGGQYAFKNYAILHQGWQAVSRK